MLLLIVYETEERKKNEIHYVPLYTYVTALRANNSVLCRLYNNGFSFFFNK